jgi:peroxiredoxin
MKHVSWRRFAGAALTAAAIAVSRVALMSAPPDITEPSARRPAPDLTLHDAKGAVITLPDFRGKVVLLDFWATWCTGCKVEIPWYMEFAKRYKKRGLSAIGVAMDDDGWARVTPYLEEHPITYPVVVGDSNTAALAGITSLPVTILIDREGRIADWHVGMVDKTAWENEIRTLLREKRRTQGNVRTPTRASAKRDTRLPSRTEARHDWTEAEPGDPFLSDHSVLSRVR